MKKSVVLIANSVIWGLVIIGCALALRGTGAYQDIQLILGGGVAASTGLLVSTGFIKESQDENEG